MTAHRIAQDLKLAHIGDDNFIGPNSDQGRFLGAGITVGGGIEGWAPGAMWIDTDASADQQHFVNEGTKTTATWKRTGGGPSSGMWFNAPNEGTPDFHQNYTRFFDEFNANTNTYTAVNDGGSGTNAYADVTNGVYNVVTAAADNDYHAITSVGESWRYTTAKKLWFEARIKVAEATTNESAWWIGFTDTLTTGGFQANALGPLGTYDGVLFYKDEATMAIDFETSNASTQDTETNLATFVTDTWTRLGFYLDDTATIANVTPYIDGTAGTAVAVARSGSEAMHFVAGIKAGPTAAAETLQIDYVKIIQER
jgi:hypothetical protein